MTETTAIFVSLNQNMNYLVPDNGDVWYLRTDVTLRSPANCLALHKSLYLLYSMYSLKTLYLFLLFSQHNGSNVQSLLLLLHPNARSLRLLTNKFQVLSDYWHYLFANTGLYEAHNIFKLVAIGKFVISNFSDITMKYSHANKNVKSFSNECRSKPV